MNPRISDPAIPTPARLMVSAAQVADLIEVLFLANEHLASERMTSSRLAAHGDPVPAAPGAIGGANLDRVERRDEELRLGAGARRTLSVLDPQLLLAGARIYLDRCRTHRRPRTAALRATAMWIGGRPT